jgi:hypothetical protein
VRAGETSKAGELVVALTTPADSALLARQQTDVLVRFDCLGRPLPGLASSWSHDSTGKTWTLTLPDAGVAATEWRTRHDAAEALRFSGVESVVPVDQHRLVVTFRQPHDSLPALFADASLGLARDSAASPAFRAMKVADARDAIDRGADIVRTADPTVLDYAGRRPGSVVAPLPWDRTYVVIVPLLSPGLGPISPLAGFPFPGTDTAATRAGPPKQAFDTAAFRAALAADAVHAEARPAQGPFLWTEAKCASPQSGSIRTIPGSTVAYPRGDEVARGLAARLVAITNAPDVVARPLEPSQLAAALRAGADRAYIVSLPRRALVPCREMADWPPLASLFALIDTRARLVLRDGVPPLEIEYDGALRPAAAP